MPDGRNPRALLPALAVLIALGAVSVLLTLQQGRQAALARAEQVAETTRLVEDLNDELAGRSTTAMSQRAVICQIVRSIADELDLAPPDCPEPPDA